MDLGRGKPTAEEGRCRFGHESEEAGFGLDP